MADTDLPLSMAGAAKARAGKSSSPPSPPGGEGATVPAPLRMGSVRPAAPTDLLPRELTDSAALRDGLAEAIRELRGYAESDRDSWTDDEGRYCDADAARMDAEAWAVVERLEGVLARCGGGA